MPLPEGPAEGKDVRRFVEELALLAPTSHRASRQRSMDADLLERLQSALADRYSLVRELGRGGMATVYLARPQARTACRDQGDASRAAAALGPERFLREIEIAARLLTRTFCPARFRERAATVLRDAPRRGRVAAGSTGARSSSMSPRRWGSPARWRTPFLRSRRGGAASRYQAGEHPASAGHAMVADFGIARAPDARWIGG